MHEVGTSIGMPTHARTESGIKQRVHSKGGCTAVANPLATPATDSARHCASNTLLPLKVGSAQVTHCQAEQQVSGGHVLPVPKHHLAIHPIDAALQECEGTTRLCGLQHAQLPSWRCSQHTLLLSAAAAKHGTPIARHM